jgi:hypothetical protein
VDPMGIFLIYFFIKNFICESFPDYVGFPDFQIGDGCHFESEIDKIIRQNKYFIVNQ